MFRFTIRDVLWLTVVVVTAVLLPEQAAVAQPYGYFYSVESKTGEVVGIVFQGKAEWLARQEDPKSHFHKLPALRRLSLVGHEISAEEMKYVATLTNVTELDVGSVTWGLEEDEVQVSGEALAHVGRMTWLQELEVTASGLKDQDWSFLPKCKSLKVLRTGWDVRLSDAFFYNLAKNESLEVLDLGCPDNDYSDKGLARIEELKQLKLLRVSSPRVTDRGIKSLAELTELEELHVFGNITAASLDHLRSLEKLRRLGLGIRQIPRSRMELIAKFKHLEWLDLSRAEIGDREIAALHGHASLRKLFLSSARVTNRSLETLESLENLEHVSLRGDEQSRRIEEAVNERIRMKRPRETPK